MALQAGTFDGTGADCTGTSGAVNRTLTLLNVGQTYQAGFLVYISGLALALTTEYTVSHNSTSTVITFLNNLWDDMTVVVAYWEENTDTTGYESKRTDFQSIVTENGIAATIIRQAETVDEMGGVTVSTESSYSIFTIIQNITKKDRKIHDMGLAIAGNSKAYLYHSYPNSITGNGTLVPQPGDIIVDDNSKRWRIEQMVGERYADTKEIFKVAIIKRINLDQ